ncbi:innate immunity activator b isoform X2 [Tachysurus vachellii]|uniref:innate immunity activator b isoform X2 n=1 Tax=Tachysurus vachellii TaxID=175792 RepID=UPI00296AFAA5|nr:innate immunity activator b isoform X2 [Tachysurus vachellii]
MEAKEEISDTDSGIILNSGLDSPIIVNKDVSTHTRAVKLKRQSLQDRLELCILELKKLCIREAELTGHLCSNYPLLPGEKPPQIRKRIGAAFKLDEQSILHSNEDSELCSVEAKLALQQQIYIAAHRLCHEEHLSKAVKKSRVQQCKHEEQKLKELQDSIFQLRLKHRHFSPLPSITTQKHKDSFCQYHGFSDNSSLSDSAVLDEELMSQSSMTSSKPPSITEFYSVAQGPSRLYLNSFGPLFHPSDPSPSQQQPPLQNLDHCHSPLLEYDPAPIQNSPWKESSLDQPYQKQKSSHSSSTSSRVPISDPTNAERERGRSPGPRRLTNIILTESEYSPLTLPMGSQLHHSSAEESNFEHSLTPIYTGSPCQELLDEPEQLCHTQHRYHYPNHISLSYVTHTYSKNPLAQISPRLYRAHIDEGRGYDMEWSRMDLRRQPSPCPSVHYEQWYNEVPLYQQQDRLIPCHLKLSRAPSFKEYPRHPGKALPRQVVTDELKSWHQRCQLRPRSLDRQCAVRIRNLPLHDSPLSHQQANHDQVSQSTTERKAVKWYEEKEIVSQV